MEQDFNTTNWTNPCPKYDCRKDKCVCGLEMVRIPASLGDDSEESKVAPYNGAYCNSLVIYEANDHVYIYTKEGIPTLIDVDASDISTLEQEVIKAQRDIAEFREDIDRFAYFFDTVADMKASDQLQSGDYAKTAGFYTVDDGGGALYKISNSGEANGMSIISINNSLSLKAHLISNGSIYVDQLGAYGDGSHDDGNVIQYAIDNYTVVRFYAKEYKIADGLNITTNHTLIGENENYMNGYSAKTGTVFTGNNKSSNGLKIYNSSNSTISVHIENITLQDYDIAIYHIQCQYSTYINVNCRKNNIGIKMSGGTYENKFDHCQFQRNSQDGFVIGLTDTHPLTSASITPTTSANDFYSCGFIGNNRYGMYGWCTNSNLFGGFCEGNGEAGIYLISSTGKKTEKMSFIGFDVENERVGYFFDSTAPNRLELNDIIIMGGQVTLLDENDYTNAVIYLKGVLINFTYVYNIFYRTRKAIPATAYDVYTEATGGGAATYGIDTNNGNRNNNFKTNAAIIFPDCLNSYVGVLPLRSFGSIYYDNSSDTITIPAGKSLTFSMNNLVMLEKMILTLPSDAAIRLSVYGRKVKDYAQQYSSQQDNGILTDGKYVFTFNTNCKADNITITNASNSDIVIENVDINALFYQ